jgi:carbamoyltransferase
MASILGLSAFYHDSAAALLVDGAIAAAAQEERFTRIKHDASFPRHAAAFCLERAGLRPEDVDWVVFYDKPLQKFDRLLETYLAFAPRGFASFYSALPQWLRQKLHLRRVIRRELGGRLRRRVLFCSHHQSHAASAFYPSPFAEAAVLTVDGVGEWATASIGRGRDNRIEVLREIAFPHSLGLLYSAFTYFCGFRVNSGEYKLMGLAPYGQPVYERRIREHLVSIAEDGSFWLDQRYFDYCAGLRMTSRRFAELFDGPPRSPEGPLTQREMDLAASIQRVTEDILLRMAREARRLTGCDDLCLAGGVALNCVANARLLAEGPFRRLWIQPAAGDAGGALGAAYLVWHELLGHPRPAPSGDAQRGSLLGPEYAEAEVREALEAAGAKYHFVPTEEEILERTAELLSQGKVVGFFHGRMEFGPRALGSRSILGDPRDPGMQSRMNLKIKFRESFRPFAPAVLREHAAEYFDLPPGMESPYMLLTAPVAAAHRKAVDDAGKRGMELLALLRSDIPAVTHVDGSARLQTVDEERHGRFARLLRRFHERTGCPVLINTSFNVRGEPIVCSPGDALRCFLATDMDALVVENFLLIRSEQPPRLLSRREEHLARFALD